MTHNIYVPDDEDDDVLVQHQVMTAMVVVDMLHEEFDEVDVALEFIFPVIHVRIWLDEVDEVLEEYEKLHIQTIQHIQNAPNVHIQIGQFELSEVYDSIDIDDEVVVDIDVVLLKGKTDEVIEFVTEVVLLQLTVDEVDEVL